MRKHRLLSRRRSGGGIPAWEPLEPRSLLSAALLPITAGSGAASAAALAPAAAVASTTALVVSATSVPQGSSLGLSAVVSSVAGPPQTGVVNFFSDNVLIGSAPVDNLGRASLTTNVLVAGTHTVLAAFAGSPSVAPSLSAGIPVVVTPQSSATTTTTTLDPISGVVFAGTPVTLGATVRAASGVPTGQVEFFDGGTSLGTATLNNIGRASLSTSSLAVGTHTITANFLGQNQFPASTSAAETVVVSNLTSADASRYLTAVYGSLFNRRPDAAGVAAFTPQLTQNQAFLPTALTMTGSPEYATTIVDMFYSKFLGRLPDLGSLNSDITALLSGTTVQQFEAGLLGSNEFFTTNGTLPATWVTAVYRNVLGRDPRPAEVQIWAPMVTNDPNQRAMEAFQIVSSQEGQQFLVNSGFQTYLGRAADPNGSAYWTGQLQSGVSYQTFVANLVSSPEYLRLHNVIA